MPSRRDGPGDQFGRCNADFHRRRSRCATARADPAPTTNPGEDKKQKAPEENPAGTASERKAVNDAVAYIRSLAQLRGRNADWAEAAVRRAASLSANDALEQHVIEIIAKDVPDLLLQLQGRKVKAADHELVLDTRGLVVRSIAPDWRTRVLLVLTHPTIAYGLLLIGIYGLLLEGYNPGAVLPGVVGALSLLLGLYGLQLLAVNYAGLALMALGIGLIITEFFMPAFGSLGVGGFGGICHRLHHSFRQSRIGTASGIAVDRGNRRGRRARHRHHRLARGPCAPPAREHRCGDHDRRDR